MAKGSIEDRQAFRVDDFIEIYYRKATEDELQHQSISPEFNKPGDNELETVLSQLHVKAKHYIESIAQRDLELGEVLSIFENQLRIIGSELTCKSEIQSHEPQIVNISEVGIAFPSNENMAVDELLRIKLILRPSFYDVNAYVRVVKTIPAQEANQPHCKKPYWIATKIVRIPSPEQQKLTKHILYVQTKQRKERQDGLENIG